MKTIIAVVLMAPMTGILIFKIAQVWKLLTHEERISVGKVFGVIIVALMFSFGAAKLLS